MEIIKLHKRQTEGRYPITLNAKQFSPNFLIKIYIFRSLPFSSCAPMKAEAVISFPNDGSDTNYYVSIK